MKNWIALLISGIIMLPCVNALANDVIEVYIDGEKLNVTLIRRILTNVYLYR